MKVSFRLRRQLRTLNPTHRPHLGYSPYPGKEVSTKPGAIQYTPYGGYTVNVAADRAKHFDEGKDYYFDISPAF